MQVRHTRNGRTLAEMHVDRIDQDMSWDEKLVRFMDPGEIHGWEPTDVLTIIDRHGETHHLTGNFPLTPTDRPTSED